MRPDPDDPFFRVVRLTPGTAPSSGVIEGFRNGRFQAVSMPGALSPALVSAWVRRLEHHDPPFLRTSFPAAFRCWFYGRPVDLVTDHRVYLDEAAEFRLRLADLHPDAEALVLDRVAEICGEPVSPAVSTDGRAYMPFTLRCHPTRGYVPLHADLEQLARPPCAELRAAIEPGFVLAFTLCLAAPQAGGELAVHELSYDEVAARYIDDKGRSRLEDAVTGRRSCTLSLVPGELVVFDSGHYAHEVTPVSGPDPRWAVVGFLGRRQSDSALCCWG